MKQLTLVGEPETQLPAANNKLDAARFAYVFGGLSTSEISKKLDLDEAVIIAESYRGNWVSDRKSLRANSILELRTAVLHDMMMHARDRQKSHIELYEKVQGLLEELVTGIAPEEIESKLSKIIDHLERLFRIGEKLYGFDVIRDATKMLDAVELNKNISVIEADTTAAGDRTKSIQINILNAVSDKLKSIGPTDNGVKEVSV